MKIIVRSVLTCPFCWHRKEEITGLVINIANAFILHHEHEEADHNIRAAYLHVIADALTSVTAIVALVGRHAREHSVARCSWRYNQFLCDYQMVGGFAKGFGKSIVGFKRINEIQNTHSLDFIGGEFTYRHRQ